MSLDNENTTTPSTGSSPLEFNGPNSEEVGVGASEGAGSDNARVIGDAAGDGELNGTTRMELREMSKSMDKGLVELKEDTCMSFVESLTAEISMHDWTEATRDGPRVGNVIRRAVYRKLDAPLRPQWARRGWAEAELAALEADGFEAEVFQEEESQAAASFLGYHMDQAGMVQEAITATGLWPEMVFLIEVMTDERAISRAAKEAFVKLRSVNALEFDDPASFARSVCNWAAMFPPRLPGVRFPSMAEVVDAATAAIEEHLPREFLPTFRATLGRTPNLRALRRAATAVADLGAVFTKSQPPPTMAAATSRTGKARGPRGGKTGKSSFRGKCFVCQQVGHRAAECPRAEAFAQWQAAQDASEPNVVYHSKEREASEESAVEDSGEDTNGHEDAAPEPWGARPAQYVDVAVWGPNGAVEMKGSEAALVDSGCTYSVISSSLALHLGLPVVAWTNTDGAPRDIGRRPIDIVGQTEAAVVLAGENGDVILPLRCIVVPDLVSDVVLGASFLGATGAIPVVAEATLLLPQQNDRVPMTTGVPAACALEDRDPQAPQTPRNPVTVDEFTVGEDMTEAQIARLLDILNNHLDVVRAPTPRRFTTIEEARFDLVDGFVPYWRQTRTRSSFEDELLEAEVQWRIDQGLMVLGPISDWSTPLFLVEKKGKTVEVDEDGRPLPGAMRLVQDLRKLNEVTIKEPNDSLSIHQVIAKAGKHRYWFVCDLEKAFLSIRVREEDWEKTASTLPSGETVYNVAMPMGAVNSPAVWNRVATKALRGLAEEIAAWMDDLFSGTHDMDDLLDRFEVLMDRLEEAKLTISIGKLVFGVREIEVLGLLLSKSGVSIKNSTRDTIRDYPRPTTTKEMRSFVGLVNFVAAWIPHASAKTMLLTQTLKKGHRLEWTPERIAAFEAIKEAIVNSDPLAHVADLYAEDTTIVVASDGSTRALGAVLAARPGDGGPDRPVMFSARTLQQRELGQGVPDLELMALVHGLEKFMPYVDGRAITVETDSKALKGMIESDAPAANRYRQRRIEFVRSFNVTAVNYVKGQDNVGPDALSRIKLARPPSEWAAAAEAEDRSVERRLAGIAASGTAPRRSGRSRLSHDYKEMATGRKSRTAAPDQPPNSNTSASTSDSQGETEEEDDAPETAPEGPAQEDRSEEPAAETSTGTATEDDAGAGINAPAPATLEAEAEPLLAASEAAGPTAPEPEPAAASSNARTADAPSDAPTGSAGESSGSRASSSGTGGRGARRRPRRQGSFATGHALDPELPEFPGAWTPGDLPGEDRLRLLLELEAIHAVRHVGRDGLVARAKALGLDADGITTAAREVVAGCASCVAFKSYAHAHGAPDASISTGVTLPNQRWCLDHAGYFTLGPERQKRWILVAVDVLSGYRMTELVDSVGAERTVEAVKAMMAQENVDHVAHLHADRGAAFQSEDFRGGFPGSIVSLASSGHAQGNGLAETGVGSTKMDLRTSAGHRGMTATDPIPMWEALLAEVTDEYNKTPRRYGPSGTRGVPAIVTTPYALFHGADPEDVVVPEDAQVMPISERITEVIKARERAAKVRQAKGRKPTAMDVGAEVWTRMTNSTSATPTLQRAKYDGPFVIVGVGQGFGPDGIPLTYTIRSPYHAETDRNGPGKIKKVNVQELKPASTMRWKAIKAAMPTPEAGV